METEPVRLRYRVRFAKVGLLRWISHRDLATLWERLARRAALPLSMTEGFHPKPRIGFPSALALGIEGLDEVVEIDLCENLSAPELFDRLAADEQPGLRIENVKRLPAGFGKAKLERGDYIVTIPRSADLDSARAAIEQLKQQETVSIDRKGKTVTADVAREIPVLELRSADAARDRIAHDPNHEHDHRLHLSMVATDGASLKPGDVLDLLNLQTWIPDGATITRTRVALAREPDSDDPEAVAFAASDLVSTKH